jgi:hypothetical protein
MQNPPVRTGGFFVTVLLPDCHSGAARRAEPDPKGRAEGVKIHKHDTSRRAIRVMLLPESLAIMDSGLRFAAPE